MDRKKLLRIVAFIVCLIFVADFVAHKLYLYSSVWYFDMVMHFLGGFWLGLVFIYLFFFENVSFVSIIKILFLVFLAGLGWEIFELYFINHVAQNSFNFLDTISDLFFDLAGGIFSILYFLKKVRQTVENKLQ